MSPETGRADLDRAVEAAAEPIARGKVVALTGAGISVDSGIPDFRSEGGLWSRFDPAEYATIEAFRRAPYKVWRMIYDLYGLVRSAAPNPAHKALADLEALGLLDGIITQNVDHLHQRAGSQRVIEIHGSACHLVCLDCGARYAFDGYPARPPAPPLCHCGAVLKPDITLFGERVPTRAIAESGALAERCETMLVIGTSALVSPASEIPRVAHDSGALIIEANPHPTALSALAGCRLVAPASLSLPALVEATRRFSDRTQNG